MPNPQTSPTSSDANKSGALYRNGRETLRLRLLFLVPLALAIAAIVATLTLALYEHEHQAVDQGVLRIRTSAQDFYEDSIRYDARALQAVMDTLRNDARLHDLLAQGDREGLQAHTGRLFEELRRDFSITHLYFHGPARTNLLRVHTPERHGDRIDRFTILTAEKNGTSAFGVELGTLGTFTLRLVEPWYDEQTHERIGYVELGMEIDRVLQKLRDFFGVEVFVLVHKEALDRRQWEDGMRTLGRNPDWERFPEVVLSSHTRQTVPLLLAERLVRGAGGRIDDDREEVFGEDNHRLSLVPLLDAGGRRVAQMALLADVTQDLDVALHTVYAGSIAALAAGILLLGFFYWQVGRVGRRIEADAQELEQLATHDGLTGLYNHRQFYALLAEEIARSRRNERPVSLFMIDIDHFKQVNDRHGHQAGDAVLHGLSERLAGQVRSIDRLCRYGGEEIALILPDTDHAPDLAERLRACIEAQPFEVGGGERIKVTVSIGTAACPRDADNGEALVTAADSALYAAKKAGRNRVCAYAKEER